MTLSCAGSLRSVLSLLPVFSIQQVVPGKRSPQGTYSTICKAIKPRRSRSVLETLELVHLGLAALPTPAERQLPSYRLAASGAVRAQPREWSLLRVFKRRQHLKPVL